uniref:Uncharacterized protein n=1 Tax=Oryza glumipatula TaxID=40148 RepID=A0A0D9ZVK4_9ORYZ
MGHVLVAQAPAAQSMAQASRTSQALSSQAHARFISAKKVGRIMEEMNRMLNASKGPTPDLLQTQQKYIRVQRSFSAVWDYKQSMPLLRAHASSMSGDTGNNRARVNIYYEKATMPSHFFLSISRNQSEQQEAEPVEACSE